MEKVVLDETDFRIINGLVTNGRASFASLGPIAAAASRPVAPSGSSSSEESGRTTFMEDQNMPREDDRNEEIPESPAPDPEEGERPGAEDDPGAD